MEICGEDELNINVMNKDSSNDEIIGQGILDLNLVSKTGHFSGDVKLFYMSKPAGDLKLEVHLVAPESVPKFEQQMFK